MKLSAKRSLIFGIVFAAMGTSMLSSGIVFSRAKKSYQPSGTVYTLELNKSKKISGVKTLTYKLSVDRNMYYQFLADTNDLVVTVLGDDGSYLYESYYYNSFEFYSQNYSTVYLSVYNTVQSTTNFSVYRF